MTYVFLSRFVGVARVNVTSGRLDGCSGTDLPYFERCGCRRQKRVAQATDALLLLLLLRVVCFAEREKKQQASAVNAKGCDAGAAEHRVPAGAPARIRRERSPDGVVEASEGHDGGYVPCVGRWGCEWPS